MSGGGRPRRNTGAPTAVAPGEVVPGDTAATAFPVDDLARLVRTMVQGSFPPLWVAGEVSQFTRHRNGHWYFTLKGRDASLRCVLWASNTWRVPTAPEEGMQVAAFGQFDVFIGRTDLQFIVRNLEAAGDGLWRKAFDEVKGRLAADGLLDEARRRALPYFPRRVAVITSPDGAALHDVVSVAKRRNPLVEVILVPAVVQGEEAPRSLRLALDRCYRWGQADVIIIGRGGGSREDLWGFNDEKLARKVAESPVPIVSAVGHEVDITICDLVADFRAPTPSAAAEKVVPLLSDMQRETRRLARRLAEAATWRIEEKRRRLEAIARRASSASQGLVSRHRMALAGLSGRLHALSPLATLERGYAVVTRMDGELVRSRTQVAAGDTVRVRVNDGQFQARVEPGAPADTPAP
ncbi:MAG: exodeoxyribonuclease VII large subunit [Gemmatimonadetes bacterium]|nr:exodeoxyribonuclease VII large subunit [Gemmatimonadota bacterium]